MIGHDHDSHPGRRNDAHGINDSHHRDNTPTSAPAADTDEYRYNPPSEHGPCLEHPGCIITRCRRFLCPNSVHVIIQRGQPRRYCSPSCRVAEHRRLN